MDLARVAKVSDYKVFERTQKFIKDFSLFIKVLTYYLKCRKNTESTNPKVARTKNGRIMLLSKRAVCDSKKNKIYQTARS